MRPPLYLPLLTLTIYLLWRGYDYAVTDQDEVLPYLLHLLDPSLYQLDWFVNLQLDTIGPRTLFVLIAWLPAKLFGPYVAVLGIYVASWFATGMALYALGLQLTRERLAATIGVILILLLTPKFTLGSNDLVTWILTPSMSAWSFGLWGLVFFVRGRLWQGALLLGIGTWLQALVGLQIAMICTLLLLWKSGWSSRRPYQFLGYYTLSSLPALGPLIWFQLTRPSPESPWSYFYILFEFRAPHHYMPTSFVPESAVGFALLLGLGLASFSFLPEAHRALIRRSLVLITGFCVLSFFCTEIVQVDTVAKLQFFKLTVLIKIFSAILVSNAVAKMILRMHERSVKVFFDHGHFALGATILITATLMIVSPDALGLRPTPDANPAEQVASWARDATPKDALFAIPPQWGHFRSQAERAIVVNFKAVPFHEPYMTQWFLMLRDLAPVSLPPRGGISLMPVLDHAFLALPPEEILELADQYGFEYIVRQEAVAPEGFESVYHADPWTVWRITPQP